jgi:hypothetical protein
MPEPFGFTFAGFTFAGFQLEQLRHSADLRGKCLVRLDDIEVRHMQPARCRAARVAGRTFE